MVAATRLV
jgi:hypothetical protein